MSFKVGTRLRRHSLVAQGFFIGLRVESGWIGSTRRTATTTNDGTTLMVLCRRMLSEQWAGEGVRQVQVTALDPRPATGQLELFAESQHLVEHYKGQCRDGCRQPAPRRIRLGTGAAARSDMPNVIAPAWKPYGHRQTI
jgi:DNA polymerase-4